MNSISFLNYSLFTVRTSNSDKLRISSRILCSSEAASKD